MQVASLAEIYRGPAIRFVAGFVGRADFVSGRIERLSVVSDIGRFRLVQGCSAEDHTDVDLMVRPDDVVFVSDPLGDAVIAGVEFLGAAVIYSILLPEGRLIHAVKSSAMMFSAGSRVRVTIRPEHIIVFHKTGRSQACAQ